MKKSWYAVYTKKNCEKKVATLLTKKKIEIYWPLKRVVTEVPNGYKSTHIALFPSFLFVNVTELEMKEIVNTNYVINFLYWMAKPAEFKDTVIENIQHFTNLYVNIKIEKIMVNINGMIKIVNEPIVDINNNLMRVTNSNIKLIIPNMGFVLLAEIEKSAVNIFNYDYQKNKLVS